MIVKQKIDKKGQVGLDAAKAFFFGILLLAVVGFGILIVMSSLKNSNVSTETITGNFTNYTTSTLTLNGSLQYVSNVIEGKDDVVLSNVVVQNMTITPFANGIINSVNYTITGGQIIFKNGGSQNLNGTRINVTASFTYNSNAFKPLANNVSGGIASFFANSGTFFAILAAVVIILIVALIIVAINRFGGTSMNNTNTGSTQ